MTEVTLGYAVKLIQTGKFDEAENALLEIFAEPAKREKAWAWLHACAKTDKQKIHCLKKILELNPDHLEAKSKLRELGEQIENSNIEDNESETELPNQMLHSSVNEGVDFREIGSEANLSEPPLKTDTAKSTKKDERKIPYKPPKIIPRNLDEDFYAKRKYAPGDFPDTESGMYGSNLITGGIVISPREHPECFEEGHALHKSRCHVCEFFAERDCPVRKDPDLLREAKIMFAIRKQHWQEGQERRDSAIEAIYSELKDHGRPLHYEILSQMIERRYPKLKLSSWAVLRLMTSHPEKFESTDRGVYKAK